MLIWLWNLKRRMLERSVVKYVNKLFEHTGAARIHLDCSGGDIVAELKKK